jgi:hypothetical protein
MMMSTQLSRRSVMKVAAMFRETATRNRVM